MHACVCVCVCLCVCVYVCVMGGGGGEVRNVGRQMVFSGFVLFMATFFVLNSKGRCSRILPLVILLFTLPLQR